MLSLEIKYVNHTTAAVLINGEMYYIKTGPDFPIIYNSKLTKLNIPNIDSWLQAQTQQRYSFRGLMDMIKAFEDGMMLNYHKNDMYEILNKFYTMIISTIFRTKMVRLYTEQYKIELMPYDQFVNVIPKIKNNFDSLLAKMGQKNLYEYLCRLWMYSLNNNYDESEVIANLIKRLDMEPTKPQLNRSVKEKRIVDGIVHKCMTSSMIELKSVSEEIVSNVDHIQNGMRINV